MTLRFAHAQLNSAMHALMVADVSVIRRLSNAMMDVSQIQPDRDLPEYLRSQLFEIMEKVQSQPTILQAVGSMSSADAYRLAHQIYLLYCQVETAFEKLDVDFN